MNVYFECFSELYRNPTTTGLACSQENFTQAQQNRPLPAASPSWKSTIIANRSAITGCMGPLNVQPTSFASTSPFDVSCIEGMSARVGPSQGGRGIAGSRMWSQAVEEAASMRRTRGRRFRVGMFSRAGKCGDVGSVHSDTTKETLMRRASSSDRYRKGEGKGSRRAQGADKEGNGAGSKNGQGMSKERKGSRKGGSENSHPATGQRSGSCSRSTSRSPSRSAVSAPSPTTPLPPRRGLFDLDWQSMKTAPSLSSQSNTSNASSQAAQTTIWHPCASAFAPFTPGNPLAPPGQLVQCSRESLSNQASLCPTKSNQNALDGHPVPLLPTETRKTRSNKPRAKSFGNHDHSLSSQGKVFRPDSHRKYVPHFLNFFPIFLTIMSLLTFKILDF